MTEGFVTGMGRITFNYIVSGLSHKTRFYCRNPQVAGSTFNINTRTLDENDLDWVDAVTGLNTDLDNVMGTAVTMGEAQLDKWDGTVWQPLATTTPTFLGSSTAQSCAQLTVVLRDTELKKVKVVVMEPSQPAPQHSISATGGDASMDNFIAGFLSTGTTPDKAFNWMVSHRNLYLAVSPFIGFTVCLNRKVRRRRGLA